MVNKWGKTKAKVGAGYEASICCMALDVSEKYKVKVKFSLEQATKAQRGRRGIVLLFL
jgi:hypothetical protein